MLNVLGFFAIVVNATMIAFVGQTYAETQTEALGGFAVRIENWHLWGRAVLIEHGMLMLRILIILCVLITPTNVESVDLCDTYWSIVYLQALPSRP